MVERFAGHIHILRSKFCVLLFFLLDLPTNIPYINIRRIKVKVKVTIEQSTKAQRWSRGIALRFL